MWSGRVLIPLKSGLVLGLLAEIKASADQGLNPFEIRAGLGVRYWYERGALES